MKIKNTILVWYYLIAIIVGIFLSINDFMFLPNNETIFIIYVLIIHCLFTLLSIKNINSKNLMILLLLGIILAFLNFYRLESYSFCFFKIYSLIILFTNILLFTLCFKINIKKTIISLFSAIILVFLIFFILEESYYLSFMIILFTAIFLSICIICKYMNKDYFLICFIEILVSSILIFFIGIGMCFRSTLDVKKAKTSRYIVGTYRYTGGAAVRGGNVINLYENKLNCITGCFVKKYYISCTECHEEIYSLEWQDEENFIVTYGYRISI